MLKLRKAQGLWGTPARVRDATATNFMHQARPIRSGRFEDLAFGELPACDPQFRLAVSGDADAEGRSIARRRSSLQWGGADRTLRFIAPAHDYAVFGFCRRGAGFSVSRCSAR